MQACLQIPGRLGLRSWWVQGCVLILFKTRGGKGRQLKDDLHSLVAEVVKKSACNAGDPGLIPGLRRPPGKGNDYPLQYSFLENYMDRRAWQATVHMVTMSWTQLIG